MPETKVESPMRPNQVLSGDRLQPPFFKDPFTLLCPGSPVAEDGEAQPAEGIQSGGRKRHHRRARKKKTTNDRLEDEAVGPSTAPDIASSKASSSSKNPSRKGCRKHLRRPGPARKRPTTRRAFVLRPTEGPLINAPKNSTQYIIEDHVEDSDGAWDRSGPAAAHHDDREDWMSPDDDLFWMTYSERDFQTAYESAHQEEVGEWARDRLIDEISVLEKRQKELIGRLSRLDPEVYLQRLRSRATAMLEKNRILKTQLKLNRQLVTRSERPTDDGGKDPGHSDAGVIDGP